MAPRTQGHHLHTCPGLMQRMQLKSSYEEEVCRDRCGGTGRVLSWPLQAYCPSTAMVHQPRSSLSPTGAKENQRFLMEVLLPRHHWSSHWLLVSDSVSRPSLLLTCWGMGLKFQPLVFLATSLYPEAKSHLIRTKDTLAPRELGVCAMNQGQSESVCVRENEEMRSTESESSDVVVHLPNACSSWTWTEADFRNQELNLGHFCVLCVAGPQLLEVSLVPPRGCVGS